MGKWRTKRKNLQKREKRRVFAAVHAEIRASVSSTDGLALCVFIEALWTPEAEEVERMRNEEERQRVDEQWRSAVDRSNAAFQKQKQILEERQRLILAIRQQMEQAELEEEGGETQKDGEGVSTRDEGSKSLDTTNAAVLASADKKGLTPATVAHEPKATFISDADAAKILVDCRPAFVPALQER